MIINHEASTITEALGISNIQKENLEDAVTTIIKGILNKDLKRPSHVAEQIRDTFSYSDLVFFITQALIQEAEKVEKERLIKVLSTFEKDFKKFFGKFEEDSEE